MKSPYHFFYVDNARIDIDPETKERVEILAKVVKYIQRPCIRTGAIKTQLRDGCIERLEEYEGLSEEDVNEKDWIQLIYEHTPHGHYELRYELQKVESAEENYEKYKNTDVPKICPECGKEIVGFVKNVGTEYDEYHHANNEVVIDKDKFESCKISPYNANWYRLNDNMIFLH